MRDSTQSYVALKINVADQSYKSEESKILPTINALTLDHLGRSHLLTSRGHFQIEGPNGAHICLALDLLGPSVLSFSRSCPDGRLSGKVAVSIAQQVLLGLSCLHGQNIGHGVSLPGRL